MLEYAIEMNNITKVFPGIIANDEITLKVKKNEIHAILGENGAGKSTLMSILFGIYKPTKGEIKILGKTVDINSPTMASNLGIGMVHQHFKLIEIFNPIQNIILGHEVKDKRNLYENEAIFKLQKDFLDFKLERLTQAHIQSSKISKKLIELNINLVDIEWKILKQKILTHKQNVKNIKYNNRMLILKNFHKIILNSFIELYNFNFRKLFEKVFRKKIDFIKLKFFSQIKFKIKYDKKISFENLLTKKKLIEDQIQKEINSTNSKTSDYKKSLIKCLKLERLYLKNLKKLSKWRIKVDTTLLFESSQIYDEIIKLSEDYNLKIHPYTPISQMTVGMQQRVEILKMLYRKNDILILDEPTAVLSPQEIDSLLDTIRLFKSMGKTVIIITHKLKEIKAIADTCTIIRKGKFIDRVDVDKISIEQLAEKMVGTKMKPLLEKNITLFQKNCLSLKDVSSKNALIKNINVEIKQGEIFAIAGVEGNGQSTLADILTGFHKHTQGEIYFNSFKPVNFNDHIEKIKMNIRNKEVFLLNKKQISKQLEIGENLRILNIDSVIEYVKENRIEIGIFEKINITDYNIKELYNLGLSYVPEDRHNMGLVLGLNVKDNVALNTYYKKNYSKYGFLNKKNITEKTKEIIDKYDIRLSQTKENTLVKSMSGGNQQKIIIGREIEKNPQLIIAIQPSRGLDVGAIKLVHDTLIKERNHGKTIILISYELDEILQIADRVAVMYKGTFSGILDIKDVTKEKIGLLMAGVINE